MNKKLPFALLEYYNIVFVVSLLAILLLTENLYIPFLVLLSGMASFLSQLIILRFCRLQVENLGSSKNGKRI